MKFDSVIFHVKDLASLREFYEGVLGLPTGTCQKDGKETPDFNESYVNYHLDGGLLCFEISKGETQLGSLVLKMRDFENFKEKLMGSGVEILAQSEHWFKIKDPDGRSLIIEPIN